MATIEYSLQQMMRIDRAVGCCLVDYESGMVLGKAGGGLDLDLAAAGNTEVVRAKMKTAKSLNLKDKIEDILITLSTQLHIIRPTAEHDGLFMYLALDKDKANLALARRKCAEIEKNLEV